MSQPGMRELYADLPAACVKIDGRLLKYRFDLERDLPWDRAAEPGQLVPDAFIADLGLELDRGHPGYDLFQWAYGLSVCEHFIWVERMLVGFIQDDAPFLREIASNVHLCEEEEKHILLFARLADGLRTARPEEAAAFDAAGRHHGESPVAALLRSVGDPHRTHYLFWLTVVLIEEFSVYFHDRLAQDPAVQPLWLRAHALHRREEEQHLVTDLEHLAALCMPSRERAFLGRRFAAWVTRSIHELVAVRTAVELVEARFPGAPTLVRQPGRAPGLLRDLGEHRAFRRTRRLCPSIVAPPRPS
jgi:hypothetical protein